MCQFRFLLRNVLPILALGGMLLACKPSRPEGILSAREMEDVLYDYHLALGMSQQANRDSVAYYAHLYIEAVFLKHGIDQAKFDSSMIWYERHTTELEDIYIRLGDRYGETKVTDSHVGAPSTLSGDTLDLWGGPSFILLSSQTVNHYTFSEKVDTTLQQGDEVQLKFNAGWHYQEGSREAVAVLTFRFDNDSVRSLSRTIYSQGSQKVSMRVGKKKVVSVEGFIFQDVPWADKPQILTLSELQLLRLRKHEEATEAAKKSEGKEERKAEAKKENENHASPLPDEKPKPAVLEDKKSGEVISKEDLQIESKKGSTSRSGNAQRRIRDSLLREEELNEQKPHFR